VEAVVAVGHLTSLLPAHPGTLYRDNIYKEGREGGNQTHHPRASPPHSPKAMPIEV